MENIQKLREKFPVVKNHVFLNHAAQSPLPKPVQEAMQKYIQEHSEFPETSVEWDCGKPLFAKLIGAESDEIALVTNTSTGLNIVANMLDYSSESNVVTTDLEYPSVVYPWLRKKLNVEVRYVRNVNGKILLEDVERLVDDQTIVLAVSDVEYVNGFKHNLGALADIAHKHGAFLLVDAIQSAGVMQINVKKDDVDFLATGCYKWLLGPAGIGYLYVRKELIEKFEPPFVGWASVTPEVFETIDFWDIWKLRLSENAGRFEVGSPSIVSFVGAQAALKLLLDTGIAPIEKRVLHLTDYLIESLKELKFKLQTPEDHNCRSGIVNFLMEKPEEKAEELRGKGIFVSARAHGIRVSPHFYNIEQEIDCFINELQK
ncbi:MAG: aminotransferase class V-fold PLP-dependent enzyme [Thermoproteota archaeon]|nr:aminotransferase class V-fold PLP-dependent enzyme [Thermoproteota archaeon]